ncbi:carbon storage regulator [Paenibacillus harenae]|uniref:carbon storage regulator n=1 Tax=Paenibacillus harenae TaxID=306543 RepID=UPI00278FD647|nr:carbon storage regulator [Paenibacillus harenae]MDQ0062039.1 carbon storage regulator [Paenibacillus harenae]
MLILSRKRGQSIIINNSIEIIVTGIEGDQVKIGIVAPLEMNIIRKEVLDDVRSINQKSITSEGDMESLMEWSKRTKKNKKK